MSIKEEFGNFSENVFMNFGMDNVSAKATCILFMSPKEVAIEDLANETGYSLASISNKMRMLERIGMIKRVKKPKSKKVYYYMEKDIIKIFRNKIEIARQVEIDPAKKLIPEMIKKYDQKKLGEKEKEHLKIIKNYYKQVLKAEKGIEVLLKELEKN